MEKSSLDVFKETLANERRELEQQCEGLDFKERDAKRYELFLKQQEQIYDFENPNHDHMGNNDSVIGLQYLLNHTMLASNHKRYEMRTIVCDCLTMFDKLKPSLNKEQIDELNEFEFYLFWKARKNSRSWDHKKFYNPENKPDFRIYPV